MIKISFLYDENGILDGFDFKGHAGYASSGNDIICAAVSALVFTTVNSVEELTDCGFEIEEDEKKGHIYFRLKDGSKDDAVLLLKSLKLGVGQIQKAYGKKYIRIEN